MNIIVPSKKIAPVTIALPVWNGEALIRRSIESHLNQDYSDFRLIISDNDSTDSTEEICREYMKADKRVLYFKNETNIGSGNNYTKAVQLAEHSKYFMWATHDDYRDTTFLSKTIKELENNPNATLCCTEVNFIDIDNEPLDQLKNSNMALGTDNRGMNLFDKYTDLVDKSCWCIIYGLFNYQALSSSMPFPNVHSGDVILMFKFLSTGDIIKVPERLLYFTYRNKSTKDYIDDMDTTGNNNYEKKVYSIATREIVKNIYDLDLSLKDKVALQKHFIKAVKRSVYWGKFLESENHTKDNLQDALVRGVIYKDDVLDHILKSFVNTNGNSEIDKKTIVSNLDEEISDLNDLINRNKFSLALFALEGLTKQYGDDLRILNTNFVIEHKLCNFDDAINILNKILDYSNIEDELIKYLEIIIHNNYFSFLLDKIKDIKNSNNELTNDFTKMYIQGLCKIYAINELEKVYYSCLLNPMVTNNIKNMFLKNVLKISSSKFQYTDNYDLSIILDLQDNKNFSVIDYITSNLKNTEVVILNSQEEKVEYKNNNKFVFYKLDGSIDNINKVISNCTGRYINIIRNNDLSKSVYNEDYITNLKNINNEKIALCVLRDDNLFNLLNNKKTKYSKNFLLKYFYPNNEIIFFKRTAFLIYGNFNSNYQDLFIYEFLLRISQEHIVEFDYIQNKNESMNNKLDSEDINVLREKYTNTFQNSKVINKAFQELKNIDLSEIEFFIDYKVETKNYINEKVYKILFTELDFDSLDKVQINQINYTYDQIWVKSENDYKSYISNGIEESQIKIIPTNYFLKSFDKLAYYIKELKQKPIIRHDIGKIKIDLKELAINNFEKKKFNISEKHLKRLLNYNSSSTEVLYYLGLSQFHQGKYEDAIESLYSCMELDFYNKELLEVMSLCLEKTGDTESAKEFLEKSKNID